MGNVSSQLKQAEDSVLRGHPWPNLSEVHEYKREDVYVPASWTRDQQKLNRRKRRWQGNPNYSREAEKFMMSRALVSDNSQAGTWEATDLLGKGAYGTVARFDQIDAEGMVMDSVAVKETKMEAPYAALDMLTRHKNHDDIPKEAFWCDYFSKKTMFIPHIRKVVRFIGYQNAWRYYYEYCPNGDLQRLIVLYADHNARNPDEKKQYIPNIFVWFVLYGLARALDKMHLDDKSSKFLDRELKHDVPKGSSKFVLHLDIKDANIMLGTGYRGGDFGDLPEYPLAKLGDFGLATLTSRVHKPNSHVLKKCGTPCWFPPEQYDGGYLDKRWETPGIHPNADSNYPFKIQHGVYCIAAAALSMCMLTQNNEWADRELRLLARLNSRAAQAIFTDTKGHWLSGRYPKDVVSNYSTDLMLVLDKCLHLDPSERLTPYQLQKACEEGIQGEVDRLKKNHMKFPPLFFGNNGSAELVDFAKRQKRRAAEAAMEAEEEAARVMARNQRDRGRSSIGGCDGGRDHGGHKRRRR